MRYLKSIGLLTLAFGASAMAAPTNYGKIPLSFEANRGQTDARVQFLSRGSGYALFLTPGQGRPEPGAAAAPADTLRMNCSAPIPAQPLAESIRSPAW